MYKVLGLGTVVHFKGRIKIERELIKIEIFEYTQQTVGYWDLKKVKK